MNHYEKKSVNPSIIIPPNMWYEYLEHGKEIRFDPARDDFNLTTAWWMAEAALIAYEHPGFARLAFRLNGFYGFIFHKSKTTESFIAFDDNCAIVAFRGTEVKSTNAFSDLITDFKFRLVAFPNEARVHQGFAQAVLEVWDDIRKDLEKLKQEKPERRLFFCGHSLGAASATLAATLAEQAGLNVAALYTFGSPKAGDKAFAEEAPKHHYRIANYGDMITQVPPGIPAIASFQGNFYEHTGTPYFLDEEHRLVPGSGDQTGLTKVLGNSANEVARHIKSSAKSAFDSAIGTALTKIGARDAEPTDSNAKTDDSETTDKDGTLRFLSFLQNTNLDAHAPVYYAVHIWNALTEEIG